MQYVKGQARYKYTHVRKAWNTVCQFIQVFPKNKNQNYNFFNEILNSNFAYALFAWYFLYAKKIYFI